MNKAQLIEWVQKSGKVGETKASAQRAVEAVLAGITYGLKKEKQVQLVGFGSFKVKRRGPRTGMDPRTHEPIKIKASKTVTFKAGKALKDEAGKYFKKKMK